MSTFLFFYFVFIPQYFLLCLRFFAEEKKRNTLVFSLYAVTTGRNGEITTKWKLSVEEMEIKYGEKMMGWWWCDVMIKWAAELSWEWAKLLWLLPCVSFGFLLLMMTITMMIATNKINYGMPHRKRRLAGWAICLCSAEKEEIWRGELFIGLIE